MVALLGLQRRRGCGGWVSGHACRMGRGRRGWHAAAHCGAARCDASGPAALDPAHRLQLLGPWRRRVLFQLQEVHDGRLGTSRRGRLAAVSARSASNGAGLIDARVWGVTAIGDLKCECASFALAGSGRRGGSCTGGQLPLQLRAAAANVCTAFQALHARWLAPAPQNSASSEASLLLTLDPLAAEQCCRSDKLLTHNPMFCRIHN